MSTNFQKNTQPRVVLVGRTNVGKSTLFNRLTEKKNALVSAQAGTTRDWQEQMVSWRGLNFILVDTGGYDDSNNEEINQQIIHKTEKALQQADLVVMTVDGQVGLTPLDEDLAKTLRLSNIPALLAITKADNPKKWDQLILEFSPLGFENAIPLSGLNGSGSGDLLDKIVIQLPAEPTIKKNLLKETTSPVDSAVKKTIVVSLIGQPNVGKSSLINAVLGSDRQIVSSQAHTTRGAQDIFFQWQDQEFKLIDTAGIRRKSSRQNSLEKSSVGQTLKKLRTADLTWLVLDISQPLTFQDRHLTEEAVKSGNSLIIVANKWDKVPDKDEQTMNQFQENIYRTFPYLTWAPILFTSALTRQRVLKLIELSEKIYAERFRRLSDSSLKTWLKKMISKHRPARGKGAGHPYIYHIKQTDVDPPAFQITIKYKKSLHSSYVRFLENNLRQEFGFMGTPLRLFVTALK